MEIISEKIKSDDSVESLNKIFKENKNCHHVVIDDFFEADFFERLSSAMYSYSGKKGNAGVSFSSDVEFKKWGSTGSAIPDELELVRSVFSSVEFLDMISNIISIRDLSVTTQVNDNGFSFFHASEPGGYLGPHTDHTRDRVLHSRNLFNSGAYHVANIIVYLSKDWLAEYGGRTQFFDQKLKVVESIDYKPNRALIFLHTPTSLHGTERIASCAKVDRHSIYFDFYSADDAPFSRILDYAPSLHGAPHRFYFPKKRHYLYWRNRKYTVQHLRAIVGKLVYFLGVK